MSVITQQQLDLYKKVHADKPAIQALTLDGLLRSTNLQKVDWTKNITPGISDPQACQWGGVMAVSDDGKNEFGLTEKEMAWATVAIDAILLGISAFGVRSCIKRSTIGKAGKQIKPAISKIAELITKVGAKESSQFTKAWSMFKLLCILASEGNCLYKVFDAIIDDMSWEDAVFYSITGTATLVAAVATDGAALVAEIVLTLASVATLGIDLERAITLEGRKHVELYSQPLDLVLPGQQRYIDCISGTLRFDTSVALKTCNGRFLTVVNNGGLGGGNVAIQTDRRQIGDWEKFSVVPLDVEKKIFALKTFNGHYLTAVNEGGIGGPNDASCPIHTDATALGPWEELVFEPLSGDQYAIRTTSGYYLTAVNAGGIGGTRVIDTDRTALGPWEKFTAVEVRPWSQFHGLGGVCNSRPAAVSWGAGRIDAFVRGTDNALWYRSLQAGTWRDWQSLGGVLSAAPAVCSWAVNRLDTFIRGVEGQLWHRSFDGTQWCGWDNLGGPFLSDPTCVSWGPNRIDVFVHGMDHALWHRWWNVSSWSNWERLDGVLTSAPAVASWGPNRLDVFARGTDQCLWHRCWDGSRWSGWENLGGTMYGDPTAVSWGPNHIDVFYPGLNSTVLKRTWDGSKWSGETTPLQQQPVCPEGTGIALCSQGPQRLDCFFGGPGTELGYRSR